MKKYKLIYIEWIDAVSSSEWKTESESLEWAEKTDWVVCQVGWLLKKTDKYIYIAAQYTPQDVNDSEPLFGHHQKIPKTWILKEKIIISEY